MQDAAPQDITCDARPKFTNLVVKTLRNRQPEGQWIFGADFGSTVFSFLALLCVIVSIAKGITPIYLFEACFWAGFAWYWHKKQKSSQRSNIAVMVIVLLVVGGEGFALGKSTSSQAYTYITDDTHRYRMQQGSGRTEVLCPYGWRLVSIDRAPSDLSHDSLTEITLSHGDWAPANSFHPEQICFRVDNGSGYVLHSIAIFVLKPQNINPLDKLLGSVVLRPEYESLLDSGAATQFCGMAPSSNPPEGGWTYEFSGAIGWKN